MHSNDNNHQTLFNDYNTARIDIDWCHIRKYTHHINNTDTYSVANCVTYVDTHVHYIEEIFTLLIIMHISVVCQCLKASHKCFEIKDVLCKTVFQIQRHASSEYSVWHAANFHNIDTIPHFSCKQIDTVFQILLIPKIMLPYNRLFLRMLYF